MTKLGKYELHEQIGRGGFGTVYRAVDTMLEREVALKVLHPQLTTDPNFLEKFRNEAKLVASLESLNIVTIYDLGETEGRVFIVMQYMAGGPLTERLEKNGAISYSDATKILMQICEGLQVAHEQGLVHRDIKPANILFDKKGNAVLSDFGLAKAVQQSSMSMASSNGVVGTPAYRAPELWRGKPPASPATDIYSLGCVLCEMLTGKVMFDGDTPDEVLTQHLINGPALPEHYPAGIPEGMGGFVQKMLAKDPNDRFQSVQKLLESLGALQKKSSNDTLADNVNIAEETKSMGASNNPKGKGRRKSGKIRQKNFICESKLSEVDGMRMLYIPTGEFIMGSEDGHKNEKPAHTVYLDDYWIDEIPVTNTMFANFLNEMVKDNEKELEKLFDRRSTKGIIFKKDRWIALKKYATFPAFGISWYGAEAYSEWAGRQLPTEAQWERFAKVIDSRAYSWQNVESNFNFAIIDWEGDSEIEDEDFLDGSPGLYEPMDIANDLWEWTAD